MALILKYSFFFRYKPCWASERRLKACQALQIPVQLPSLSSSHDTSRRKVKAQLAKWIRFRDDAAQVIGRQFPGSILWAKGDFLPAFTLSQSCLRWDITRSGTRGAYFARDTVERFVQSIYIEACKLSSFDIEWGFLVNLLGKLNSSFLWLALVLNENLLFSSSVHCCFHVRCPMICY